MTLTQKSARASVKRIFEYVLQREDIMARFTEEDIRKKFGELLKEEGEQ
jgi:hypothetical protein